jgi:hypothetical protein
MDQALFGAALRRLWPHADMHIPGWAAAMIDQAPTLGIAPCQRTDGHYFFALSASPTRRRIALKSFGDNTPEGMVVLRLSRRSVSVAARTGYAAMSWSRSWARRSRVSDELSSVHE